MTAKYWCNACNWQLPRGTRMPALARFESVRMLINVRVRSIRNKSYACHPFALRVRLSHARLLNRHAKERERSPLPRGVDQYYFG